MTIGRDTELLEAAFFHALQRERTDILWIVDADGFIRYVSPAWERVLQHDRGAVLGRPAVELVHTEDRASFENAVDAATPSREMPGSVRFRLIDAAGRWRCFDATVRNFIDEAPIRGVLLIGVEYAQVEGSQQDAEDAGYHSVFEATMESLVIHDLTGRIVETNSAASSLYGYAEDEMIGKPITMLVHPDSRDQMTAQLGDIASGPARFEGLIVRKDGASRHIEGRATLFSYRGAPHMLSMARDITERVRRYELLEQRVAERTRELSTVLDVSRNVASTLQLQPLLDLILDQLKIVVDYTGAGISIQEGDEVRIIGYVGPGPRSISLGSRVPVERMGRLWHMMQGDEPLIIEDVLSDEPAARIYRETVGEQLHTNFAYVRSWMAIPMRFKHRDVGSLFLENRTPRAYTLHHAVLALAIARQAAIAIENARLYAQAQELATLEERARLARELHDSVTQALFSMTLHARTAEMLAERESAERDRPLMHTLRVLNELTRSALAEMRALIFELRPGALKEEGLFPALRKHASAVSARSEIPIEVEGPDDRIELPETAEENMYRIAQEALHNAVNHASPTHIIVRLHEIDGPSPALILEVEDNGSGFEVEAPRPGHMGLQTMQQRAEQAGGWLEIESESGRGTIVRFTLRRDH